ncbi:uncharacterized protein E0L32_004912 [Thyridium curvatum]|uniref:Uncharacterized protein n=1 Tax=Thyridium curvatum TaxID=1093900 RepID=A0A507AYL8_9PEZI|nr:uncharacterized protein E0L32_004912 [Thyridium curvatum]TPX15082.1 hypothetical protein E0L32_004912 [Thyridium curvatum]
MPPVNHAAVSAGVIAISVAVAAAIAVYESPELRRMADDLRRRIAIALHSLGDNVSPNERGEPVFNRPEDAEGFLQSRGSGENAVDADDETRRRQREELMYWNRLREEKKEKELMELKEAAEHLQRQSSQHGSTFDDFMRQDKDAEKGTYVFNSGTDVHGDEGLVHRRPHGVRGLNSSVYANPFADEYGIDVDEPEAEEGSKLMTPDRHEIMSDIYSATEPDAQAQVQTEPTALGEVLFDAAEEVRTESSKTLERELGPDEFMTAGQDDRSNDAYTSIQAWAQNSSNPGFYSPLPATPSAPMSEPEVISEGMLTPTDSASTAGSGEDIANEVASESGNEGTRYYDVMSEDEDGMMTPASWTEVGSVVSESDAGAFRTPAHA